MMGNDWKQSVKDVYEFIFHDDSVASNVTFAVLAYVVIKYVFFPVIGWVTGTSLPIVAVISNSMYHPADWYETRARCFDSICSQEDFYAQYNISKEEFASYPFSSGFRRGDIMLVRGKDSYEQGDVVVYQARGRPPVIHRVVKENKDGSFVVKGDRNPAPITETGEANLSEDRILGVAYGRIPFLGYIKILLSDTLRFFLGGIL